MPIDESIFASKKVLHVQVDSIPYTVWLPEDSPVFSDDANLSIEATLLILDEIRATRIHFYTRWVQEDPTSTVFH